MSRRNYEIARLSVDAAARMLAIGLRQAVRRTHPGVQIDPAPWQEAGYYQFTVAWPGGEVRQFEVCIAELGRQQETPWARQLVGKLREFLRDNEKT